MKVLLYGRLINHYNSLFLHQYSKNKEKQNLSKITPINKKDKIKRTEPIMIIVKTNLDSKLM